MFIYILIIVTDTCKYYIYFVTFFQCTFFPDTMCIHPFWPDYIFYENTLYNFISAFKFILFLLLYVFHNQIRNILAKSLITYNITCENNFYDKHVLNVNNI